VLGFLAAPNAAPAKLPAASGTPAFTKKKKKIGHRGRLASRQGQKTPETPFSKRAA